MGAKWFRAGTVKQIPLRRTTHPLTHRVVSSRSNAMIALAIVFFCLPVGRQQRGHEVSCIAFRSRPAAHLDRGTRFVCAGLLLLLGLLRWSNWFGAAHPVNADLRRRFWWRGGLIWRPTSSLSTGHLRVSPRPRMSRCISVRRRCGHCCGKGVRRMCAWRRSDTVPALLALSGVFILVWPSLRASSVSLPGELLGISCSVLWTLYWSPKRVDQGLSGVKSRRTHHVAGGRCSCRSGWWKCSCAAFIPVPWQFGVQAYCHHCRGVVAFGIWNVALRAAGRRARSTLFNNLIPAQFDDVGALHAGRRSAATFWIAMALIVIGVIVGPGRTCSRPKPPEWF